VYFAAAIFLAGILKCGPAWSAAVRPIVTVVWKRV
jgi:hypothetical protein